MSIKDRIRNGVIEWLTNPDHDVKGGLPYTSSTAGRHSAPDRRAFNQQVKAYMNQVVLACIATRAQTLNEPPMVAVDPNTKTPILHHPVTRLFRRPNPDMAQSMFWQYVSTYTDIGGNAYIHKVRNVYGQVIHLRPYHSGHIVPISDSGNWVDYYKYDFDGIRKEIPPEDMIHIRSYYIDPSNPVLGVSPIRAAGIDIDTYDELMQTLYSYLKNNGVPSGVLTVQNAINQMQTESLREQFTGNTTGKNRGKPIVLPSGMSYQQMGLDVSKMEASAQFAQYETAICGIFRVHPSVAMTTAGLMSSTYSNMATAFQEYTSLTRVPTWNTWEEQVQLAFAKEYPDIDVEFDTSNIAALQSDPDAVIYPVIAQFNSNLITVDEARQRMGYAAAPEGGDKFSYQVVPATGFGFAGRTGGESKGLNTPSYNTDERGRIDQSRDQKATDYWKAIDKATKDAADDFQPELSKMIVKVGDALIPSAVAGVKKNPPSLKALIDEYMRATKTRRESLAQEILKLSIQEVGADLSQVQTMLDDAIDKITRETNEKITDSIGAIKDEVQATVADMAGETADKITKRLTEKFETLKESRAKAIAQTTSRATSSTVSTDTWHQLNEEQDDPAEEIVKVWTTRRDGKVRESHKKLDGEWVKMTGEFDNGLSAPAVGDVKDPSLVVNCRCILRPVKRKNL